MAIKNAHTTLKQKYPVLIIYCGIMKPTPCDMTHTSNEFLRKQSALWGENNECSASIRGPTRFTEKRNAIKLQS